MVTPDSRAERQLGAMRTKVSALLTQLERAQAQLDLYAETLTDIADYDSEPCAQMYAREVLASGTKGER